MTDLFNTNPFAISHEQREVVIRNMKLELAARVEKLRAMEAAQRASMKARMERRVNRIPATLRNMTLRELLTPPSPEPAEPAYAAPTVAAITKQRTAVSVGAAPAPAPATRKTRAAPTATAITKTAPAAKTTTKTASKPATTRTKKRSSDEMSSEDKENALDVPKKRVRGAQKAPAPTKSTAPTTRTTRAASRHKAAPSQILSPKTNNSTRQKPAKAITRPR
ncbi:hypothetical protein BDU57DRAFT_357199 [Ampelomyces quisqualis]|uniref:Borealin N-terminal domain-containing protein n=1 Tax=Ampelomyces quisqualis TaxID=50730 RepID=A0A6A5QA43_AMPQU|nr:hypothetical protein BDU57DRAFT_357199 [Ampelomyces quisqualis]